MKIYRGTDGDTKPVEMECYEFGYPNKTTTGEIMYANTHFKTERDAWESILRSVKAGVEIAGHDVANIENKLIKAQKMAGEAARDFWIASIGYNEWIKSIGDKAESRKNLGNC